MCYVVVLVFMFFGHSAGAADDATSNVSEKLLAASVTCVTIFNQACAPNSRVASSKTDLQENQGCCSHHGGVCGCSGDGIRAMCCDGATSPSCGC